MNKMKKLVSVLSIGAMLTVGSMAQAPSANAGIILCPAYGVGLILIVIGAVENSLGLIILSDTDGSMNKDALSASLMTKYQDLGISNSDANDVSHMIKEAAKSAVADVNGKVSISISAEALSQGLQASNMQVTNPALFNQLAIDLK